MPPTAATVTREFLDPKTGQTWTLTYARGSFGHTVRCEPPFGMRPTGAPVFTDDVELARRKWRAIQRYLVSNLGLVSA